MKLTDYTVEEWHLADTQLAAFRQTVAFRIIMRLLKDRLGIAARQLQDPAVAESGLRVAQGEHLGLMYGIMVYEDAIKLGEKARKRS